MYKWIKKYTIIDFIILGASHKLRIETIIYNEAKWFQIEIKSNLLQLILTHQIYFSLTQQMGQVGVNQVGPEVEHTF